MFGAGQIVAVRLHVVLSAYVYHSPPQSFIPFPSSKQSIVCPLGTGVYVLVGSGEPNERKL